MKLFLPKRGKYILTDGFWFNNPDNTITVKAICLGWNVKATLAEMVDDRGEIRDKDVEIEIPSGTIINITGYNLTPYKNNIKFSIPKKDNKHLSVKMDYEKIIRTVAPNAVMRVGSWSGIAYTVELLKSDSMSWQVYYDSLNGLECEECTT